MFAGPRISSRAGIQRREPLQGCGLPHRPGALGQPTSVSTSEGGQGRAVSPERFMPQRPPLSGVEHGQKPTRNKAGNMN